LQRWGVCEKGGRKREISKEKKREGELLERERGNLGRSGGPRPFGEYKRSIASVRAEGKKKNGVL